MEILSDCRITKLKETKSPQKTKIGEYAMSSQVSFLPTLVENVEDFVKSVDLTQKDPLYQKKELALQSLNLLISVFGCNCKTVSARVYKRGECEDGSDE